ncbi:GNAT family N-acetyltransferase [Nonlabens xiamenensis]|uniref:GNAT family N-acetyltransferase n=1 Tax=Nonlabens xiamenensis TaxID=2341043 RepID=UPI000F6047E4|nr:GNAT family N-acetyltransferase [Nonlabens xiamenensis]
MLPIQHSENDSRGIFYIKQDHQTIAELTYSINDDVMVIDHTEVQPSQEGKGLGSRLVKRIYEFANENKRKINPLCPFAEVVFDRHSEWNHLRV